MAEEELYADGMDEAYDEEIPVDGDEEFGGEQSAEVNKTSRGSVFGMMLFSTVITHLQFAVYTGYNNVYTLFSQYSYKLYILMHHATISGTWSYEKEIEGNGRGGCQVKGSEGVQSSQLDFCFQMVYH